MAVERGRRVRDPHARSAAGSGSIRASGPRTRPDRRSRRWRGSSTGTGGGGRRPCCGIRAIVRPRQLVAPALVVGSAQRKASSESWPPTAALVLGRAAVRVRTRTRRGPWRWPSPCPSCTSRGGSDSCSGSSSPQPETRNRPMNDVHASVVTWRYPWNRCPSDARIFVAGHRGLVGSAVLRRLEAAGYTNVLTATPRTARLARPGRGQPLVPGEPTRVRVPRRRHRRRHHGELHPAGGVPLRQHDDPRHGRAREPPLRRDQAALPGQLVHLPAPREPADHRGGAADRRAGADERAVRDRQDRRASSCASRTAVSTAATSSPRCRRTSTARTTTSISSRATCCRR